MKRKLPQILEGEILHSSNHSLNYLAPTNSNVRYVLVCESMEDDPRNHIIFTKHLQKQNTLQHLKTILIKLTRLYHYHENEKYITFT